MARTARVQMAAAAAWVRRHRTPAFLHLRTVRLWGHAGSDAEQSYRSLPEIEAIEARDPYLRGHSSRVTAYAEALTYFPEREPRTREALAVIGPKSATNANRKIFFIAIFLFALTGF